MRAPIERMALGAVFGLSVLFLCPGAARAGIETKTADMGWTYSIRLPEHLEKTGGAPLIIGFHESGSDHEQFLKTLDGMDFLKNCYLAAPNAPRGKAWDFQSDPTPASTFVDEVQKAYKPTRTIVIGFGRGAAFALPLCLTYPLMQGCILCSSMPCDLKQKAGGAGNVAYYVMHGTNDMVFMPTIGKQVFKQLEAASISMLHYEEVPGMGHEMPPERVKDAFAWLDKMLGPAVLVLSETEATDRLKALEKALKDKDWEAVKQGLPQLAGIPKKLQSRMANLVKACFNSGDETVSLAAVEFSWHLGQDGLNLLKTINPTNEQLAPQAAAAVGKIELPASIDFLSNYMKGKSDIVACAAVQALGDLKTDPAITALVNGLVYCDEKKITGERMTKAMGILKVLCEEDYDTVKQWKDWLTKHSKK